MRIFPPQLEIGDTEGFSPAKDLFGRAELGRGLANLVGTLSDPTVIAVDGQWGAGKSTFLKMWAGHLRKEGFPVIYFDAFENDYVDDAFAALAGEIIALLDKLKKADEPKSKEFVSRALSATKVIARSALKVGVKAATMGALEAADLSDLGGAISSEAERVTDKYIGELITKKAERAETLAAFRDALRDLPAALTQLEGGEEARRPLIFIIDELDRCRPVFALEMIERIKHFYAVPNVHFVLGTHIGQLQNSVRAAYGSNIDANMYLQKFIHLVFPLSGHASHRSDQAASKYVTYLRGALEFETDDREVVSDASDFATKYAIIKNASLRNIERIMTNIALAVAYNGHNTFMPGPLISGLSVLRVVRSDLYDQARRGVLDYESAELALGLDVVSTDHDDSKYSSWDVGWWKYALMESVPEDIERDFGSRMFRFGFRNRGSILPVIASRVIDRLVPFQK